MTIFQFTVGLRPRELALDKRRVKTPEQKQWGHETLKH